MKNPNTDSMTTELKIQVKAEDYPFAQELIIDTEGHIRKVILNFNDYLQILEALEDEGLIRAMMEVKDEKPLSLEEAQAELEKE